MAWSTRQLAELADTSVRAVRHYHDVGLLDEPVRRANGYKSYGVAHLVRVLRIKRLTDLGFSLAQIGAMGDDESHPGQALRTLDAELSRSIERLQRVRLELALIMRGSAPTDLPPELAAAAADADLSDADRAFVVVMTRVLGPSAMEAYADVLNEHAAQPAETEFNDLPADADERSRRDLAQRLAPEVSAVLSEHPVLRDPAATAPRGARNTARDIAVAMDDLYNPAQIDVLRRVRSELADASGPGQRDAG